ncbi:4-(cytidine 5'-diphospho)-2-C-methyl-D-erythritol kinase [soil metagenome]
MLHITEVYEYPLFAGIFDFLYPKTVSRQFTLPSFAKINWTLRILGKREDGFHELCTVLQTVSLHDTIRFEPRKLLRLTCDDRSIPRNEKNIIIAAAQAMQYVFSVKTGASIHLEKRIPSPGGLGGGSSNAVVAMIGLARLWGIRPKFEELYQIAYRLGSDVPFFLHGGTATATARGETIEPMEDIIEQNLLIVTPDVAVPTREAFANIKAPNLTNTTSNHILRVCRSEAGSLDPRQSTLINDFEASIFRSYPEVKRVKEKLLELGTVNVAMSGSGASVFAIFDKIETRQTAEKALDIESTWRKFAVSTVSRAEYRELLHLQGA